MFASQSSSSVSDEFTSAYQMGFRFFGTVLMGRAKDTAPFHEKGSMKTPYRGRILDPLDWGYPRWTHQINLQFWHGAIKANRPFEFVSPFNDIFKRMQKGLKGSDPFPDLGGTFPEIAWPLNAGYRLTHGTTLAHLKGHAYNDLSNWFLIPPSVPSLPIELNAYIGKNTARELAEHEFQRISLSYSLVKLEKTFANPFHESSKKPKHKKNRSGKKGGKSGSSRKDKIIIGKEPEEEAKVFPGTFSTRFDPTTEPTSSPTNYSASLSSLSSERQKSVEARGADSSISGPSNSPTSTFTFSVDAAPSLPPTEKKSEDVVVVAGGKVSDPDTVPFSEKAAATVTGTMQSDKQLPTEGSILEVTPPTKGTILEVKSPPTESPMAAGSSAPTEGTMLAVKPPPTETTPVADKSPTESKLEADSPSSFVKEYIRSPNKRNRGAAFGFADEDNSKTASSESGLSSKTLTDLSLKKDEVRKGGVDFTASKTGMSALLQFNFLTPDKCEVTTTVSEETVKKNRKLTT